MRTASLLICLLPIFACSLRPSRGEEIIIEAAPEGQNHDQYSEPEGKWADSRTPPASAKSGAPGLSPRGSCGSRKILFWRTRGEMTTAPATARFTPRLGQAGRFHVYATWTSAANATPVRYRIRHAEGESVVTVRQDGRGAGGEMNSDRWVPLGSYPFTPDSGQGVELMLEKSTGPVTRSAFGQVVSDAVKFTRDEGTASSPGLSALDQTPGDPPVWYETLPEAQESASRSGKKILVFFYLPGNAGCEEYEKKLFSAPEVSQLLKSGFVTARIDLEKNQGMAASLKVFRAGTINLYDSRGNALDQLTERMEPEGLAGKLKSL